jgi:hypothetical protein
MTKSEIGIRTRHLAELLLVYYDNRTTDLKRTICRYIDEFNDSHVKYIWHSIMYHAPLKSVLDIYDLFWKNAEETIISLPTIDFEESLIDYMDLILRLHWEQATAEVKEILQ